MPGTGPTVHAVQRLRVYTEPAGSFAVDHTGTLGDYTAVPAKEGSLTWDTDREMIDPGQLVQYHWDGREKILGKKKWTLSFTMPLAPTGTAASDGVTAVTSALGILLKAVMGGQSLGVGTRAVTGWSSSSGDVDAGEGAGLPAGNAMGWVNSSSVLEAREVEQRSTDTITSKLAFSGTPANTNTLYASATYYLTSDPDTSLQFIVEGLEQTDRWLLLGGQGSFTLSLPIGDENAIPEITFTFTGANWMYGDETAGTLTGSDLAISTYSAFQPIAGYAGRLLVQTVGTATFTGATVNASAIAVEPAIAYMPVTSPSGTQSVLRWRVQRPAQGVPVKGSFTTYFEDFSRFDWRDNQTDLAFFYQIGTAAGSTVLISIPTAQATKVIRQDASGIAGEVISLEGRKDADTVEGSASDLGRSPLRIHLL